MANIKELHGVNASGADEVIYPVTEASLVGSEHGTIVDEIPYMVSPGVAGVLPADMVPPVYGLQTGVSTRGGGFTMGTSPVMEYAYGVEHDITNSSTSCTRIGNMSLHASLPIQSKMRRCLLKDDGSVNYYLSDTDSTKKGDGTDAVLDGTDGMVMVEIPAHWRRFEQDGNIMRVWLSTVALPGFHFVPKCYRSAYEAAVDRTVSATPKLASVVNTSASFRGGNNNADWDGTYRSLLGMPATTISLTDFRAYARNRGTAGKNGAGWNCDVYDVQKTCWWLYAVEYANFNCQLAYNAEPTSEGYKQGGLGPGVTTVSNWDTYNRYYPFVPCGHTNSLGNKTGVVDYAMPDSEGGVFATVSVPSYRGLENPFGHVWSWTDGCKCNIQSADAGGVSEFFVCTDPAKFQDSDYTDYEKRGELPRKEGFVKIMMIGEYGENMPVEVGASSTTYFADYFYTNVAGSTGQRGVHFGGAATYGVDAGLSFAVTNYLASATNTAFGSRLCFLPSVEASEWYHPTGAPKVASLPLLGDEVVKTDYWSAFPVNPPYTISIIFKTGSTVYGAPQCLFSSSELSGTGIRVEINANARFQFRVGSNNRLGPTVTSNTLYCLQIVYDGTSVTFYDNGDRPSLPFTDAFTSTTFVLGNYGDGAAPFLGEIVSCHVLNYAVSAADVKALWNEGDPVRSASPLVKFPATSLSGSDFANVVFGPNAVNWAIIGGYYSDYANGFTGRYVRCFSDEDSAGVRRLSVYSTLFAVPVGSRVRLTIKYRSSEQVYWGSYSPGQTLPKNTGAAALATFEFDSPSTGVSVFSGSVPTESGSSSGIPADSFLEVQLVSLEVFGCVSEWRPSGLLGSGLTPAFSKATVTGVSTRSGGMGASDSTLAFSGDRSIEILFTTGDQITNTSAQCVVTDYLGSGSSVFLGISITGTFYLYIGGTIFYLTPSVIYRAGSRYHFVISYAKGSVANVYVNGESHGSVTTFASSENGNGLYLGYLTSTGGNPFLGVVNHARVYNYALSVDDVSALWNSGNPGEYIIPATGTLHEGCVAEYLPDRATVDAWYPSIGSAVLSAVASPRPVGDIVTGASMWQDSSGHGAPALAAVGSPSMSYAPVPAEDEIILDSGYFVTDISTAVKNVFLPQGYVPVSVTVYNGNPSDITNVSVTLGNANRFAVYGATVASGSSVTGYIGNATTGGALLTRIIVNGLTSSFYIGVNATGNTSSGGMRVKVRCRYALGE